MWSEPRAITAVWKCVLICTLWTWEYSGRGCDLTIRGEDSCPQGPRDRNSPRGSQMRKTHICNIPAVTAFIICLPTISSTSLCCNSRSCRLRWTSCINKAFVFRLLHGQCHSVSFLLPLFNLTPLWIHPIKTRNDLKVTTFEIKAFGSSPLFLICFFLSQY